MPKKRIEKSREWYILRKMLKEKSKEYRRIWDGVDTNNREACRISWQAFVDFAVIADNACARCQREIKKESAR